MTHETVVGVLEWETWHKRLLTHVRVRRSIQVNARERNLPTWKTGGMLHILIEPVRHETNSVSLDPTKPIPIQPPLGFNVFNFFFTNWGE